MPNNVPVAKTYWNARLLDILAMSRELEKPTFFITLTMNDNWPELQAFIKYGPTSTSNSITLVEDNPPQSLVDYSVASIVAYMRLFVLCKQ